MKRFERDLEEVRAALPDASTEELYRITGDLNKIAEILFDYLVEQRKHGRNIDDPWQEEEENDPSGSKSPGVEN